MSIRDEIENHIRSKVKAFTSRSLVDIPISPNALTIIGLLLAVFTAILIANNNLFWGGITLVIAGCFDMFDGALARTKNKVTQFGAFLDSTLDRYSDALIMLGLIIYYQHIAPQSPELILIFITTVGALLTSYIRTRAEALGLQCKVGLLGRPERILLIIFALISGFVSPVLWILAVLTNITALQRLLYVWSSVRTVQGTPPESSTRAKERVFKSKNSSKK